MQNINQYIILPGFLKQSNGATKNKPMCRKSPIVIGYEKIDNYIYDSILNGTQIDWNTINMTEGDNKRLYTSEIPPVNKKSIIQHFI